MADTSEKRKFSRLSVAGRIDSDVHRTLRGSVIDLSLGGACIEQEEILRPGWLCELTLRESGGASLNIRARVVSTNVKRLEKRGEDRVLIYRAGLEFVDVTPEQRAALQRILSAT